MKKAIMIVGCALALLGAGNAAGFAQETATPMGGEEAPSFTISRLIVATDVSEREPVGAASEFSIAATKHLFAFVEVENPSAEPAEVLVVWVDTATGKEQRPYTLEIGAKKRWRTWARVAAPEQPGSFAVVLKDGSGNELGRTPFQMVE